MSLDDQSEELLQLKRTHFSCRVYRPYLVYLRKWHPEIDLEELSKECGLPLKYLEREGNFVSTIFDERFTRACIEKTGNSKLCFDVGAQSMNEEVLGKFVNLLVTRTFSTREIYNKLSDLTSVYSKVTKVEKLKALGDKGELIFQLSPIVDNLNDEELVALSRNWENIVANTIGHYAAVPASQGFRPAEVKATRVGEILGIPIYRLAISFEGGAWLSFWLDPAIASVFSLIVIVTGIYLGAFASYLNGSIIAILITTVWSIAGHRQFKNLKDKFDAAIKAADLSSRAHSETLRAHEQVVKLANVYKKFVPQNVINELGVSNISLLRLGDSRRGTYTVAFIDVRGFSGLAESAPADIVFRTLNVYLGAIAPAIENNNGWIDNIMGDGVFAIFPANSSSAIKCAKDVLSIVDGMRGKGLFGSFDLNVGIGISRGDMIVGTLGYAERMQATVISDTVNLASRLEKSTKTLQHRMILDEETFRSLPDHEQKEFVDLGNHPIDGRTKSVRLFGYNTPQTQIPVLKKHGSDH